MKTVFEMLKPRESVFSDTAREDVLNLSILPSIVLTVKNFSRKISKHRACPCSLI